MIDWKEEEKQYIEKAVDSYLKEQSKMPLAFLMSKKTLNKNIEKVKERATDRYRVDKLNRYREEIEIERKRIDKTVELINNKFNDYVKSIKGEINTNVKPFKLETKEYDYASLEPASLEKIEISCEPFKIAFLQERIGE